MAEAILAIFSREEEQLFLGQAIFANQKTKKAEQENDRHVIKATKEVCNI
jgi:hypothetical protein